MIILANCKRYFRDNKSIIVMFFLPIVITGFVYFVNDSGSETTDNKIAVINLDKGIYGNELIKTLKIEKVYRNKAKALDDLKAYKYTAVYELPTDFTSKITNKIEPIINTYKIQNGNINEEFENKLKSNIKEIIKINILKKSNLIKNKNEIEKNVLNVNYKSADYSVKEDTLFPVMNIMYLMIICSTLFNKDLLELRKSKVLERIFSTANHGYRIMGGIYISIFMIQSLSYIASLVVINFIFNYGFENFAIQAFNIVLISLISTSIAIAVSRTSEEYDIGTFVIVLVDLLMISAYFIGSFEKGKYMILEIIMKFTPFYWAMDSIKNVKIFPNSIILMLIALMFFTAGSMKYSKLAKM